MLEALGHYAVTIFARVVRYAAKYRGMGRNTG